MPGILDWYRNRNSNIIRQPLREIKESERDQRDNTISDAIKFFNRDGDVETVRYAMVRQFATRIRTEKEKGEEGYAAGVSGTSGAWEFERGNLDVRPEAAKAILNGQIEAVNTGLGPRIVQSLSTLSGETQSYIWVAGEDKDAPLTDVETVMRGVREQSRYASAFSQLDMMSCMVESALLHVYYKGDELRYDVVQPHNCWLKYGNKLQYEDENGNLTQGYVDYTEIEDASAVIIKLSSQKGDYDATPDEDQYCAYVGCCDGMLEGRYVVYRSRKPWPLPDPGDKSIDYEHYENGMMCNPLTWLRHNGKDSERDVVTTEYPIVLFRGGHRLIDTDSWPPTTTSLYENCQQIEIAWSRVLRYSLLGARGVDVFKRGMNSNGPTSLQCITLEEDDEYEKTGWGANHSVDATKVVSTVTEQVGGGYHVPAYMLLGELAGVNPSSGIALALRTKGFTNFRYRRTELNRDAVSQIFYIERSMLVLRHAKDVGELLRPDIKQRWSPGTWEIPAEPIEAENVIALKLSNGTINRVEAVKREYHLSTSAEAIERIKTMDDEDDMLKPDDPEPKYVEDQNSDKFPMFVEEDDMEQDS